MSPSRLLAILHTPRLLTALVVFADWPDIYSLLSTCTSLYAALFAHVPTRDAVLARFVPGYAFCLRHRDMQFYQDVPITIHDLDLLLISQRTDLHRYPTHALRTLTAPNLTTDTTTRLIKLTQAHSRFVLLFQSLVHSSPLPIHPDPPEDRFIRFQEPSPELTFPPPLAFTAQDVPPPLPPKDKPRKKHKPSSSYSHPRPRPHPHPLSVSTRPNHVASPSRSLPSRKPKPKSKSCLSIFNLSDPSPPPPPPQDPQTLRLRSKEWRRPRSNSISAPPPSHSASLDYPSDTEFDIGQLRRPRRLFASEPLGIPSSSASSLSDARSSWNQGSTTSSRSSPPVSPHGYSQIRIPHTYAPPFAPSIHSLLHATIRNRAPILRVFVPTQHMHLPPSSDNDPSPMSSLDSSPERPQDPQILSSLSIQACEAQLHEAGLWDHLSTGDVICNFGYIPLDDGEPEFFADSVYTPRAFAPSHRASLRSFSHLPYPNNQVPFLTQPPPRKTWLIFTGHSLLPFTPPSLLPLPSSSPLSLPSPFYYYHILPAGANPLFEMSELPPLNPTTNVSLALIKTTSLVPSPLSPTGFAKVKKFAWTARAPRTRPPFPFFPSNPLPPSTQPAKPTTNPFAALMYPHSHPESFQPKPNPIHGPMSPLPAPPTLPTPQELGDGWLGEWVVEYEGTSEGRDLLLAALEGKFLGRGRVWEVRRERSGGGRVWMRLLPE